MTQQYYLKFFKGCLPQVLLGPFLNTLSHLVMKLGQLVDQLRAIRDRNSLKFIRAKMYSYSKLRVPILSKIILL